MAGSEFGPRPAPGGGAGVERYRRAVREVADHRVVDEAEEVLTRAWLAHLDEMRRAALSLVAAARMTSNAARAEVRRAMDAGGPAELAIAKARLHSIEAAQQGEVHHARAFIASVDAELALVCRAGAERARRDRADDARLRAAWREAFGGGAAE